MRYCIYSRKTVEKDRDNNKERLYVLPTIERRSYIVPFITGFLHYIHSLHSFYETVIREKLGQTIDAKFRWIPR